MASGQWRHLSGPNSDSSGYLLSKKIDFLCLYLKSYANLQNIRQLMYDFIVSSRDFLVYGNSLNFKRQKENKIPKKARNIFMVIPIIIQELRSFWGTVLNPLCLFLGNGYQSLISICKICIKIQEFRPIPCSSAIV